MPSQSQGAPRPLPERPNFRHLKHEARDLLKSGAIGKINKSLRLRRQQTNRRRNRQARRRAAARHPRLHR